MNKIRTRTGLVAYEECGSGTPIVLLHANPGDHHDFDGIIPALAEQHRVVAVDWPAYGQSDAPISPSSATAMQFADVLEDFVTALNLPPAIFLGNSVGGFAAARLAIRQPDRVRGLILVSPGGFFEHTLFTRLFCQIKGHEFIAGLVATQFARYYLHNRNALTAAIFARTEAGRHNHTTVAVDAAIWRSFAHPQHDLRHDAAHITAPTLIIIGQHDPVIHANVDGKTAQSLIPNAQLVIPDTGHEPFAEAPDEFLATIRPFLAQLEG